MLGASGEGALARAIRAYNDRVPENSKIHRTEADGLTSQALLAGVVDRRSKEQLEQGLSD